MMADGTIALHRLQGKSLSQGVRGRGVSKLTIFRSRTAEDLTKSYIDYSANYTRASLQVLLLPCACVCVCMRSCVAAGGGVYYVCMCVCVCVTQVS